MRVTKDDDMPERMKRGNATNPERVPAEGHEGATAVGDKAWRENERRVDHAWQMVRKDEDGWSDTS